MNRLEPVFLLQTPISGGFVLCKVHAAALLRWRSHQIPPADKL
jgi:hypothetical protein